MLVTCGDVLWPNVIGAVNIDNSICISGTARNSERLSRSGAPNLVSRDQARVRASYSRRDDKQEKVAPASTPTRPNQPRHKEDT